MNTQLIVLELILWDEKLVLILFASHEKLVQISYITSINSSYVPPREKVANFKYA